MKGSKREVKKQRYIWNTPLCDCWLCLSVKEKLYGAPRKTREDKAMKEQDSE